MIHTLVVSKAFEGFVRGDIITEPNKILQIIQSDHKRFVRPVALSAASKG
jgi:hypothetical protein